VKEIKNVELREMCTADLPEVLAIETESQPHAWTEKIFREELGRDCSRLVVLVVGTDGGIKRVAGFCNYWLVADEVQLLNIACSVQYRRRGYGELLMRDIVAVAKKRCARLITLEVRSGNVGAISLYEKLGFQRAGLRRAYYADNHEDALVMLLVL